MIRQVDYNKAVKIATKIIDNAAIKREDIATIIKIGSIGRSL